MAEGDRPPQQGEAPESGDRYWLLFVLLLTSFVVVSSVGASGWGRVVSAGFFSATLVLGLHTSRVSRRTLLIGAAGAAAAVLATAAATATGTPTFAGLIYVAYAVLLFGSIPAILRRIVRMPRVTVQTAAAALCIYVLIGLVFASVFYSITLVARRPQLMGTSVQTPLNQSDYYYFSFVTLTTTGYGDIVAATGLGRGLAVVEALTGQAFLTTLVAIIISRISISPGGPRALKKSRAQVQSGEDETGE